MPDSTVLNPDWPLSNSKVGPNLLDHEDGFLSSMAREGLWEIFREIGRAWQNVDHDSAGLKSSWLEFIEAKTKSPPSYIGEYANALSVVQELVGVMGREKAYQFLFFSNAIAIDPPLTRLGHAKRYVINEFIVVQITASGFRGFTDNKFSTNRSVNYMGFVRGSRYNERPTARLYNANSVNDGKAGS